ncbi:anti-sigma-D factor RsdA [Goodfellowiella coeruleoviolacea]|uniref:Anti-sigma-D factor RsdA to sigma factor binding region n=1 Tax=Goodfellowiella coeruleoviolacea TaxID=334858 RepID=A0AAE3GDI7_9PSEU|nr:anti-sigma-D factor RsdA [Goodfellowiella coeruleoviolacea]MCP2165768.1 Anti-sigma-D factor RsdA to sigma factor binding region [Goodfellowiella coeruleoviolacea]
MAEQHANGDEEIVRSESKEAALTSGDPLTGQNVTGQDLTDQVPQKTGQAPGERGDAGGDLAASAAPGEAAGENRPTEPGPVDAETPQPDDVAAIRADDILLNALGGSEPEAAENLADQELNSLLLAWRRDVDSERIGELVDTDTALATLMAARKPVRNRHRFLVPFAAAAAVLVITFTGVGLAARDARPGDALWAVAQVLYSEHARSVEAAASVQTELDSAGTALREGRIADARTALDRAGDTLPSVSRDDGQADLVARHESLVQQLPDAPVLPDLTSTSSQSSTQSVPSPSHSPSAPPSSTLDPTSPPVPSSPPPPAQESSSSVSSPSSTREEPNPPIDTGVTTPGGQRPESSNNGNGTQSESNN